MLGILISKRVEKKRREEEANKTPLSQQEKNRINNEVAKAKKLIDSIKTAINSIAKGERKIITDKLGYVFVTNSKKIFGNQDKNLFHCEFAVSDFFKHIGDTDLPLQYMLKDFEDFLSRNAIEKLDIRVGINQNVQINEYWIKTTQQ